MEAFAHDDRMTRKLVFLELDKIVTKNTFKVSMDGQSAAKSIYHTQSEWRTKARGAKERAERKRNRERDGDEEEKVRQKKIQTGRKRERQ